MDLSRRVKKLLLCFLVAIHLFFRYPSTPRAIGSTDSFYIMGMTSSIKENHGMAWLENIFSYAGLYPFSYPSGAPASLATVWTVTGLDLDWSLYVFSLAISLVGLFGVFMLASTLHKSFTVRYSAAFAFTVSPIIFRYTFWMLSARALFVCLLPVFVWFLFRTLSQRHGLRYGLCAAFMFPVMMFVHHIGLFLPVLITGYLLAHLTSRAMERLRHRSIYSREIARSVSVILLAFFVFLLALQTLMESFYSPDLATFQTWYLTGDDNSLDPNNHLVTLLNIGIFYTVSAGVLILCGVFGFAHLIEKKLKNGPEWGMIFILLAFAYFLADQLYLVVFLMPILMPLIGYGIYVILSRIESSPGFTLAIFTAILLTALPHAAYSSDEWVDWQDSEYGFKRYAHEDTVATSIYLGQVVDSSFICNDEHWARRLRAYSGEAGLPVESYEYPVLEEDAFDEIGSERVDLLDFYLDKNTRKDQILWTFEWKDKNESYDKRYSNIVRYPITRNSTLENLSAYDLSVAVVTAHFPEHYGQATQYWNIKYSPFFHSLQRERFRLYENEHEIMYQL